MGAAGAAVFAAQMMNFTLAGTGSSGHIGGGFLLAAVLGPVSAYLVMSVILTVQCLLFGDGGLLALGCNLFNMGIVPCFLIYPLLKKLLGTKLRIPAAALGGALSMFTGALCAVEHTSAAHILLDNIQSATTLLPDYAFRAVENALSSGAAGLIGCAAVFTLAVLTGAVLTRTAKAAA